MSNLKSNGSTNGGKGGMCNVTSIADMDVYDASNRYSLWLFIFQLTVIVVLSRTLARLLRPLHVPCLIAEILAGVILGPSCLGRSLIAKSYFPVESILVLETVAYIGLLFFLFLIGVEMDLTAILHVERKAINIGLGGMILPIIVGYVLGGFGGLTSSLFYGVFLAITSFSTLARMLAELKLLNTEVGRTAMSSALVSDMCSWVLFALAIALAEGGTDTPLTSLYVILLSILFVIVCIFLVRPLVEWMIRRTPEGESVSNFHICLILTGVMISGFIADAIGTHSVLGTFMFGLIIPNNGPLGVLLIERLEDFISGLLLPLFFAISGLRTNIDMIHRTSRLFLFYIIGCLGKVLGTAAVSSGLYQMPVSEGISLGLLMNTKGMMELLILNVGRDQMVFGKDIFPMMVLTSTIMTAIITPIVTFLYRPRRKSSSVPYKQRTFEMIMSSPDNNDAAAPVQDYEEEDELRLLACIHTPKNVSTMINLLEATNPTRRSPISVHVLHLVELTRRAMLVILNTSHHHRSPSSSSTSDQSHALNRTQAEFDHIYNALENYSQHAEYVTVYPLTAISPYETMHEDICRLAEDEQISFIIIPFHKHQTVDGGMEPINPVFQIVNQNVLANAPCSVGILVDRGFTCVSSTTTSCTSSSTSCNQMTAYSCNVAVLFFGGPDDREAIAYACRMSDHPCVTITVIRFLPAVGVGAVVGVGGGGYHPADESITAEHQLLGGDGGQQAATATETITSENEKANQLDEDYIDKFRRNRVDDYSVKYKEVVGVNMEQTAASIKSAIHSNEFDLFIVGKGGEGTKSPKLITTCLTDKSECSSELGPIGDLLASSDFSQTISVLVVQQYVGPIPLQQHDDHSIQQRPSTMEMKSHQ